MNWERIQASVNKLLSTQQGLFIPFEYDGEQYHGCRASLRREDVNSDAGLAESYTFSLLCPSSQFTGKDLPKPRQSKVTVDGLEYRVLAVETDAIKATVRLHLGEALA